MKIDVKELQSDIDNYRKELRELNDQIRPLEQKRQKLDVKLHKYDLILCAIQSICVHEKVTEHTDFRNHGRDVWTVCDECGFTKDR